MLLTVTAIVAGLLLPVVQSQTFTIQAENSINVTVGGTANFTVKPSRSVKNGNWDFNGKSIGLWIGSSVSLSNEYKPRAEIRTPNGSLELKSVTVSDSGKYTVTMVPEEGEQASATITLHVIESISKPIISADNISPVEHNDTVTLECNASGPVQSYYWLKGNTIVDPGDRITLSQNNKTLTISGVLRTDRGFICHAYNAIDWNRSEPYLLNVSYGPESLNITINPQHDLYILGSNVILSCSAISKPISEFQWYLNGNSLHKYGQQLIISDITLNNTGNYTCEAFNIVTKRYSVTMRDIIVVEPVSKPFISSNNTTPVEYDTVVLMCHASGTAVSYQWLKENETIEAGDRFGLSSDNSTLTIFGVLRSDEEFICYGYNMINENASDPYLLNVNYGPEIVNMSIDPPLSFHTLGSSINLSCSADSNPASEFRWYLNGNPLQHYEEQLIIDGISLNDTGNYTCEALNNATQQNNMRSTDVMVLVEPVSKPNVTANATNLIEFNDTVALTCIASGTAVSYQWLEENSPITPSDRIALSDDNSSLTISGVLRSDGGFTCYAFNAINGMTSDPYHLNVSYGPDLPKISIKPDLSTYPTGRKVTFSCSVDANPSAELEWLHNDTPLQQKGRDLIIVSISLKDSGNYTCQAFNNLTKRCNASAMQIVVLEPVNNVTISSNNSAPVESLHTILLTCRAMGSVQSRIWYKDNKVVKNNDRMMTSEDNTTLTIINVDRNDSGIYTCYVFSSINNDSRGFNLIINYGPDEVIIRPPGSNQLEPGASLTLSCSASSVPPAIYKWYNGDNLLHMGQTYNIDSTSQGSDGNYTCQAHNTITNKNRSSTVEVTIQEKGTQSNKLSAGAIVGILIGVLAAVLVTGLAVWQNKKKHCRGSGI
ncbi:carcinoembryonic antigen-related cell adhesion molecule 5-like isoform X2 [Stegostoma tigrinum]|uniref:carcinoembryonic antigen-related cell adhesion molecule 5-like isoform X2 n=1 Tax=Stegostoma tigrinum TaxID=3053191 RepID=UPI00202AFDEF|nr:carcinoembryonic antigen-related cell adhesion molecule 5-like isoform X2 [Stegostoma tigrinum]